MKRSNIMKLRIKPIVAACALAMAAGQAGAIDYYLAAKQYDKVLMPGTPLETTVPMWGYVIDPDNDASNAGDCYEAGDATARQSCVDGLPDPTVPGPQLSMPSTDNQLRIFLKHFIYINNFTSFKINLDFDLSFFGGFSCCHCKNLLSYN